MGKNSQFFRYFLQWHAGQSLQPGASMSAQNIAAAKHMGLAPLLYQYAQSQGFSETADLNSIFVLSKFQATARQNAISDILARANQLQLAVCLLKGSQLAYYIYNDIAERPMADIDLLVERGEVARMRQLLFDLGYIQQGRYPLTYYQHHHHDVPFYHPQRDVWIELHWQLLPNEGILEGSGLLGSDLTSQMQAEKYDHGTTVQVLQAEFNLIYLVAHWAHEIKAARGIVLMFDWVALLKAYPNLSAQTIASLIKHEPNLANALYIVLAFLKKQRLNISNLDVLWGEIKSLHHIDFVQRKIMLWVIKRYFVDQTPFGRLF